MIIINQDHDEHYNLSTKDIHCKPHYATAKGKMIFMGWNLYGKTNDQLLGTFDSEQACKIVLAEIQQRERSGKPRYTVPTDTDGLEGM